MLKRIRALIKKEYRQIRRDKRTLAVLLFLPMFLLIMFGYAVNFDVHNIKTAVYDQDMSPESRELIKLFTAYEYFDVERTVKSLKEIDRLINTEKIQAAIIIPPHFGRLIHRHELVKIQFLIDGVNGNIGSIATNYMVQIVADYSKNIQVQALAKYGLEYKSLFQVRERIWYNPELKSTLFLLPGLIAFILMITAVVSTALSVVREKELNTIEQITVSPVRSFELMVGKAFPYMIISLTAGTFILIAGWLIFGVSVAGSLLTLFVASLLFLFGALGQGLLISTVAHNQAVAFMMAILSSLLPTLLLSGFIFRIASMPVALQIVSYLVPARYFLVILRGVMLKGTDFTLYFEQFLFLLGFMGLMIFISSMKMSKSM
ncbi:ABC transporter permease [candidate division CSSED10-310 bacterium]|uniref:Transport permease protein n=1 Tax=candidate division CSSED10-310 bacterium TaxID=2855610 RepID=A0ABV6YUJ7_UNCC1